MIVWRVFLVVCMVGVLVLGPASAAYPVLSKGSSGDAVRVLQHLLNHWGSSLTVDGSFGTGVKNAVKALQSSKGLVVDGVVGTETWSNTHVTVSKTSTSSHAIRAVQQALRMHDIAVSVSGTFDTATDNGVRTFQRNEGLGVDGWVGKNTWRSLLDTSGGGSSEGVDDNIPIPSSINPRYSYARHSTMKSVFGTPGSLTTHCSSLTNRKLKRYMVTKNVGPFRVTGLKWAVEALARIFTKVKRDKLHVFNSLKSNGMLCCRAVRGSTKYFSNHSWGSALDLVVNGKTDPRGDGKCFRAILDLYPYFEAEKFYWGAGFSYEDAMHFEVSNELAKSWEDLYT